MDALPFVLPAALFVALELLWCRPRATAERAERAAAPPPSDDDDDPFALPFVRRRLAVLTAELARLDTDEGVYAKGFRRTALLTACESLAADAARLTALRRIEVEFGRSPDPLREELDV